jgi:hypothetical protein
MDLKEIGWEDVDWMDLAQARDQLWTLEYGNLSSGPMKGREFID